MTCLAFVTISSDRLFSRLTGLSLHGVVEPGEYMDALQPVPHGRPRCDIPCIGAFQIRTDLDRSNDAITKSSPGLGRRVRYPRDGTACRKTRCPRRAESGQPNFPIRTPRQPWAALRGALRRRPSRCLGHPNRSVRRTSTFWPARQSATACAAVGASKTTQPQRLRYSTT